MLPEYYQTYVRFWYEDVIDNNEQTEHIFEGLFGKHNLTAQAEEKPKVVVAENATTIDSLIQMAKDEMRDDYLKLSQSILNCDNPAETSQENSLDVAESVETSTKEDACFTFDTPNYNTENHIVGTENTKELADSFASFTWNAYRLDLAKEIAVAVIRSDRWDFKSCDPVEQANEIVKRLKETEI